MTKTMTSVRVVVTALGMLSATGCDVVFGLTGEPEACTFDTPFDTARFTKIARGDHFSIAADRSRIVLEVPPMVVDQPLPDGMPTVFDIGGVTTVALSPEGDALMYSTVSEPPELLGATRHDGIWELGKPVPLGTFAGTPSADAFGPRRVLVKLRDVQLPVQEYEDVAGTWTPVGAPFDVDSGHAPNLTPSGLTMVFIGNDYLGEHPEIPVVMAASRDSTNAPFGEPRIILQERALEPQLLGAHCEELYLSVDGDVRRYDR